MMAMAEDGFEIKHLSPQDADYEYSTSIKVTPFKSANCEGCYTVSYFGPLYHGCGATAACMPQSYQVLMDKTGKLINDESATKNGLKKYNILSKNKHDNLSNIEFSRLIEMSNNAEDIADVYGITATAKDSYAAKISSGKKTAAHGNTAATFITHITMARRKLLDDKKIAGDWVNYTGIYPGYEVAKKGEHTGRDEVKSDKAQVVDHQLLKDNSAEGKSFLVKPKAKSR